MTSRDTSSPAGGASEFDAYFDGELSASARAAFEARLATDEAMRAEVELQRRIDGRLRELLGASEFPGMPDTALAANGVALGRIDGKQGDRAARGGLPSWVRVAAAVAVVALGAWAMVTKPWAGLLGPAPSQVAADAVYNRFVRTGFEPATVCDNDAKFLDYTAKELGTSFLVRADPGVHLVGWTYSDGLLGEHAKVLLARRGETPVIVVMDRATNDRQMRLEPGSALRLHRAKFGGLVLYEIGPDAEPAIISHLKSP